MIKTGAYILITPARNEEAHIEKTILSVISQTIQPIKWVIVSDGSTDRTDEIVKTYAAKHGFINFLRVENRGYQGFASKVHAFNAGYEIVKNEDYEFIGNLDGDVSFNETYYESIIAYFLRDNTLGIAGGDRYDIYDGKCERIKRSPSSVMGAVQLFRRRCFEDIGGYMPISMGGIDAVAEIMARMHGWGVRTFFEIKVYHHRRTGTAHAGILSARFRQGVKEYILGYHPAFELLRCLSRAINRPWVIGSLLMFCGYCYALASRVKREVPAEVVNYLQKEQLSRIKSAPLKIFIGMKLR